MKEKNNLLFIILNSLTIYLFIFIIYFLGFNYLDFKTSNIIISKYLVFTFIILFSIFNLMLTIISFLNNKNKIIKIIMLTIIISIVFIFLIIYLSNIITNGKVNIIKIKKIKTKSINLNLEKINLFFILSLLFFYTSILFFNLSKIKNKITIKLITEISACISISVAFSILSDLIFQKSILRFSLSILPIYLISIRHNYKVGILTGFIYSFFNAVIDGYLVSLGIFIIDYILAFSVIGLTGLFKNYVLENKLKDNLILFSSIFLFGFLKYIMHSISGILFFGKYANNYNIFIYSFIIINSKQLIPVLLSAIYIPILRPYFINEKTRII